MGLRDSISKGIDKANRFVADQQKRYNLQRALDNAEMRLASLFSELGKISYYGTPLSTGRTANVIKDNIAQTLNTIETLKQQLSETATTK